MLLYAHNPFLQVAVDLGLPGLIAWFSILLIVIAVCWQIYQVGISMRDAFLTALGAGLLCSQIALIVHGMLDAVTWGMVKPAPVVWVLWGLAISSYLLKIPHIIDIK